MFTRKKLYGLIMTAVLLTVLAFSTPASTAPPPPNRPQRDASSRAIRSPDATAPVPQTVEATEVGIQARGVYTWTQDTAADWEAGTPQHLSITEAGVLQLERRYFSEDTTITAHDKLAVSQRAVQIAVDGSGTVYAVWEDLRNGNRDIYFAYRTVGGNWSTNIRVNDDAGQANQLEPALAVDDAGNVYVVWTDDRHDSGDIYFAYRPAGGNFESNVKINDDVGSSWQRQPDIAVDGNGKVYAVWCDDRLGDADIYFSHWQIGSPWSINVRLNDDTGDSGQYDPALAVDSVGNAHAAWIDRRVSNTDSVYFSYRPAGGTWVPTVLVNDDTVATYRYSPDIAVDNSGNAYALWRDDRSGNSDIYFAYRPAEGLWETDAKVNDDVGSDGQYDPALVVDGSGNAYAAWTDYREGDGNIYFSDRPTGGAWGANARVNDDVGAASQHSSALALGTTGALHGAWVDTRNANYATDIYGASYVAATGWSVGTKINDDVSGAAEQEEPDLIADAQGNAYALWRDYRNGNWDIYFAYRSAEGAWSTNVRVNDDSGTSTQSSPDLAIDDQGNAYAIWHDFRNGDEDIYFAYRPVDGSWGVNVKVNDDVGTSTQKYPAIAVAPEGDAYAVWLDERNSMDIYFAYRPAGGGWGSNVPVNDEVGSAGFYGADIAVDATGNAHALWMDRRNDAAYPNKADIYYAYRPSGGAWGANSQVNDQPGSVQTNHFPYENVDVDAEGNVYALWVDDRNGSNQEDIYFAYKPATGTWGANVKVNASPALGQGSLAVDAAGNAYAAWAKGWEVHYAKRPASTGLWGAEVQANAKSLRTTNQKPVVAVDTNEQVYLLFTDYHRFFAQAIAFTHSLSDPPYYAEGTYTSPELNTGVSAAAWDTLAYSATLPAGTSLTFETRSRQAGGTWSAWAPVESGEIASPPAQFLQYRAVFSSTSESISPLLDWVKIMYRSTGTPSAPRFVTLEGVTNQTNPPVRGVAAAGSVVHIFVDGTEVSTATVDADGFFSVAPDLTAGAHTLSAQAKNTAGQGPPSDALELTVDPDLPYDPVAVRAGEWSKDGWLLAPPRDSEGAANPQQGWRIWPRADKKFRVEMPVTYTTSAAVTVTVGTQTITLTEEAGGYFVGIVQPPIQEGDFVIKTDVDGKVTTIDGGPVLIEPDGLIYAATGTISDTLSGVEVTCYYSDTHAGQWVKWEAWHYDQVNPQTTLDDGYYTFYSPAGTYRVVAEKEGYPIYTSPDLVVVDTPVRHNIPLGDFKIYLPLVMRQ